MNVISKNTGKKIALITGGSEGIGAALVGELLRNNYSVIAVSRSLKKLNKLKSTFSIFKEDLKIFSADVNNLKQLIYVSDKIKAPDLLVLNAGIYEPVDIETFNIKT